MAMKLRDLDPSGEAGDSPPLLHALAALETVELVLEDPRRMATSAHAVRGAMDVLRSVLRAPGAGRAPAPRPTGRLSKRLKKRGMSGVLGELSGLEEVLGRSPAWQRVLGIVARVADTPVTALLEGESGTGKELLARVIHGASKLAQAPFVAVNCGALPGPLLEAELFGHTKGAFTGAASDRRGRFKEADGGTLFLDEIGEIPVELQAKLLRALQSGEVQKLGQDKVERVEVRVLAATNRDLPRMAREGAFREDLFYRLAAIRIHLPPLRERTEEILPLLEFFLARFSTSYERPVPRLSDEARAAILACRFPGNIRELENLAKHLLLLTRGEVVELADLPPSVLVPDDEDPEGAGPLPVPRDHDGLLRAKKLALHRLEGAFVRAALTRAQGNVSRAARETGMNRAYLQRLAQLHAGKGRSAASDPEGEEEPA